MFITVVVDNVIVGIKVLPVFPWLLSKLAGPWALFLLLIYSQITGPVIQVDASVQSLTLHVIK